VRFLDAEAFGEYRLLWLAWNGHGDRDARHAGEPYYFLPRSDASKKRLYINQTLLFLALTGLISAWAVSAWNPWLPEKCALSWRATRRCRRSSVVGGRGAPRPAAHHRGAGEVAGRIDRGPRRAARAALSLAAILSRELGPVLHVLLAFVAFKVALLLGYVVRHHGLHAPILDRRVFSDQLRYAAPLGVAGALYGLRMQADQWSRPRFFPGVVRLVLDRAVLGP